MYYVGGECYVQSGRYKGRLVRVVSDNSDEGGSVGDDSMMVTAEILNGKDRGKLITRCWIDFDEEAPERAPRYSGNGPQGLKELMRLR